MGTVRDYFDTEARALTVHKDWQCNDESGGLIANVVAKIAYDFDANAKYWYFFIPDTPDLTAVILSILQAPTTSQAVLGPEGDGVYVEMGFSRYSERQNNSTFIFTRRVHLYIDADMPASLRTQLNEFAQGKDLFLAIKDREYAKGRTELEKPLAFISHDFRDKQEFVRDLAIELSILPCPVWYDEFSLKVGDSLRENIERGLRQTPKCVVILSSNFFDNKGWVKAEFDSIYTREIVEGHNVMLPVWHNVTKKQVYEYSPRLVDKLGIPSSLGAKEVARQLYNAIKSIA